LGRVVGREEGYQRERKRVREGWWWVVGRGRRRRRRRMKESWEGREKGGSR